MQILPMMLHAWFATCLVETVFPDQITYGSIDSIGVLLLLIKDPLFLAFLHFIQYVLCLLVLTLRFLIEMPESGQVSGFDWGFLDLSLMLTSELELHVFLLIFVVFFDDVDQNVTNLFKLVWLLNGRRNGRLAMHHGLRLPVVEVTRSSETILFLCQVL